MKSQRLGTTMLMATSFCPAGTFEANGTLLQIQEHQALFSLYGLTYGGDGRKDFALPDLRATAPAAGLRYCIVGDGAWPARQ
jgi:microcystin-dependent protein